MWCSVFVSGISEHDGGAAAKPAPVIYSVDRLRADAPPPPPIPHGRAPRQKEIDEGHPQTAEVEPLSKPAWNPARTPQQGCALTSWGNPANLSLDEYRQYRFDVLRLMQAQGEDVPESEFSDEAMERQRAMDSVTIGAQPVDRAAQVRSDLSAVGSLGGSLGVIATVLGAAAGGEEASTERIAAAGHLGQGVEALTLGLASVGGAVHARRQTRARIDTYSGGASLQPSPARGPLAPEVQHGASLERTGPNVAQSAQPGRPSTPGGRGPLGPGGGGGTGPPDGSSSPGASRGGGTFSFFNPANRANGIVATLDDGVLSTAIEATGPGRIRGSELFGRAVEHFGRGNISGVRGAWTYGDNLATFNRLTGDGMSVADAARQTFTGRMAGRLGFGNVEVLQTAGSPGAFTNVQVVFR